MKWQELKKLKKIKLEANEKTDMRRFLSVRIAGDSRHIYQRSFLYFNLFNRRNMFAGILAIILLITGGGTTFAAEGAIPGDILYPIKIEVNEKVLSAFALNQEKKADWSARQAERRLEEAANLSEGGKLNSENSAFLAGKLKEHLDKTNNLVKKLEDKGNIQAAAKINSHLKYLLLAHIQVNQTNTATTSTVSTATTTPNIVITAGYTKSASTQDIDDDEDKDKNEEKNKWKDGKFNWGKLQKEIKSQLASSTVWEINLQDKISTSTAQDYFKANAAAGVKKATENKLEEINKYYEHKKDSLNAEAKLNVQTKLNETIGVKTEADQKLNDGKYVEAFALYNKSMSLAQQAKSLIQHTKEKNKEDEDKITTSTLKIFNDDKNNTTSAKKISDEDEDEDEDDDKNDNKSENSKRESGKLKI